MPDIAMCRNAGCSKRKQCYRYMAKPNEYWQAYNNYVYDKNTGCDHFWSLQTAETEIVEDDDIS